MAKLKAPSLHLRNHKIATCPSCNKKISLEKYKINPNCNFCLDKFYIIETRTCLNCKKPFLNKSNEGFRYCHDCKKAWKFAH